MVSVCRLHSCSFLVWMKLAVLEGRASVRHRSFAMQVLVLPQRDFRWIAPPAFLVASANTYENVSKCMPTGGKAQAAEKANNNRKGKWRVPCNERCRFLQSVYYFVLKVDWAVMSLWWFSTCVSIQLVRDHARRKTRSHIDGRRRTSNTLRISLLRRVDFHGRLGSQTTERCELQENLLDIIVPLGGSAMA